MFTRGALLLFALLISLPTPAKDKKDVLPDFVLKARSVRVIASPDSGIPLDNPRANTDAVEQVIRALNAWGRFTLVAEGQDADLMIVIQPGSKSFVSPTLEKRAHRYANWDYATRNRPSWDRSAGGTRTGHQRSDI